MASGLASLALFAGLGEYAKSRPLAVDREVALWFKAHRTPGEVQWAQVVSALTTPIIVFAAILMLLFYLNYLARSWYLRDFIPFAFVLSCAAIATVAKPFFDRVRPGAGLSTLYDFEPSYPSSHVLYLAAAVSSLFLASRNRRFWIFFPVLLFSSVIGLCRLVLGVHWLTDSVGAVFLAMGMWIIYFVLDDWLIERERSHW